MPRHPFLPLLPFLPKLRPERHELLRPMNDDVRPEMPGGQGVFGEDLDEGERGALEEVGRDMIEEVLDELRGESEEEGCGSGRGWRC